MALTIWDAFSSAEEEIGPTPATPFYAGWKIFNKIFKIVDDENLNPPNGKDFASDRIDELRDDLNSSKGPAIALAKLNYIMESDYKYLMLDKPARGAFLDELKDLKLTIENQKSKKYSGDSGKIYKAIMLGYIEKIMDMNNNFDMYNDVLKSKLNEVKNNVTQDFANEINKLIDK